MSTGFTVGDISAAMALAADVERDCKAVAMNAPLEFQYIIVSISALPHMVRLLYDEAADTCSPVLKPEQKWFWLAGEMLVKINFTLRDTQARAKKYRNLGDISGAERQEIWDKIENSADSSLESLRAQVCVARVPSSARY